MSSYDGYRFHIDDELIKNGKKKYRVVGWSPRGKLRLQGEGNATESAYWWYRISSMPKGWVAYRDGERLN